ncbi:hypothetical protein V8F33_006106 [Rhypophila sp. PSN 637]
MKTSRDKDVPDYKALPLRWPFLLALLTFTCGLLGLLEHLIRTLPNELNRKEIPHEFPFIPAEQKIKFSQFDATTTVSLPRSASPTTKALGPTDASAGPSITEMPSAMVTKRAQIMAPRPPTSAFANPGILTTYITWINSWAGNPNDEGHNPYTRTPLFPGQEPEPDQCVYQYQGIVMTSNRSACAAIVTPDFNVVLPAGWKRATWLNGRIWFPVGGGCDENYDDWYSGYPSNKHFDLDDLWYQMDVVVPAFESCSVPGGKVKRSPRTALSTRRSVKEARQDITPGRSVVFLYVANHKRGPDNRIIWPMGPDPGGRPWFRGAMYYLARLIGTDQFVMENGRPYLDITTMTSTFLVDISTAPSPPSSMMTTTSTALSTDTSSTPFPGGITTSQVPEPTSSIATSSVESESTERSRSTHISSSAMESSADVPSSEPEPTDTSSGTSTSSSQHGSSPDASGFEQNTSSHTSTHPSTAVTTDTKDPSNIPPVTGIPVTTSRPGTSRLDVISDVVTPSVTQIPTTLSSLSTSSTTIFSSSISLPSASSSVPHWVTYIQIPVTNLRIGTQTSTDSNGWLTTYTEFAVVVETQLAQIPAIMATASLKTLTDPSNGQATATITQYGQADDGQEEGQPILITTLTTLTNSLGQPTATINTIRPITSIVQTLSDPTRHVATATITQVPIFPHVPGSKPAELVLANTAISYYAIYFLPVLLTACLLIPIQAIDSEIKLLLPYRLLTATHGKSSSGSTGNSPSTKEGSEEALTMNTSGLLSRFNNGWSVLFFRHHDPISIISDVMLLSVAILITISVETIGLKLRGSCTSTNVRSCILTIAVFSRPARVAQALLVLIVVCILVLWFMLARWKSGLAVHPGSVASICSLVQIPETRDYLLRGVNRVRWESSVYGGTRGEGDLNKLLERQFRGSRLRLGWEMGERAGTGPRAEEYGLVFCELGDGLKADRGRNTRFGQAIDGSEGAGSWWWWPRPSTAGRHGRRASGSASITAPSTTTSERRQKRTMKYRVSPGERTLQFAFLFVLCGLLAMVLYYENTEFANPSDSPFEYFMDSQSFGVSMLFSGLGQVISFSWDYFFFNFDKRSIYRLMSHRPQPARRSVLHVRSPTVISGLLSSIRHRDVLAASISVAGILSKFLPAPLASVPFQSSQTWQTHEICVWTTVALLLIMIVILMAHMWLVKWPAMPAAPDSLAGWIYYVIDSAMLRDFERLSMVSTKERDKRVERMGRLYRFGWMTGVSGFGVSRIGIEYPEGEQGFKMYSLGAAFGMGITGRS